MTNKFFWGVMAVALSVLIGVNIYFFLAAQPERHVGPTASETSPASEITSIPTDQLEMIVRARAGLSLLADKSPRAKVLLEQFDVHSAPSVFVGASELRILARPKGNDRWFAVAVAPRVIDVPNKNTTVAAQFYCTSPPHLLLHNIEGEPITFGLMLAHELVHAEDCLWNGMPANLPRFSPTWLMAEISAHRSMSTVLNEYTDQKWSVVVEHSRRWREAVSVEKGMPPYSTVSGHNEEDVQRLRELFPGSPDATLEVLLGQLGFEVSQVNIQIHAMRMGMSEEKQSELSLGAALTYYKRHLQ